MSIATGGPPDAATEPTPQQEARRRRTVAWVVALATLGLVFDGYDLVVYGTVVPLFLADPGEIGPVTPAVAGALGSYALFGVLVGALLAGSVADIVGRRTVMLTAYAWFSVGMGVTALMDSTGGFGVMRFVTGLGVGALVATTGALVAEYAPPGKKNLANAITYSGVPIGSLLAALLAILLLDRIGWRGMFWIGALPLVTLLPLAWLKMPESPSWLASRGRSEEARRVSERTGVPISAPAAPGATAAAPVRRERAGFAGLFSGQYWFPTVVLGLMSATGLVLVYVLNTWLPELMGRAGYSTQGSLSFLLVLNGGAVVAALLASRLADRFGPKMVVAASFLLGAVALLLLTVDAPLALLLLFVAVVGAGTSGTQILIYGFVANYYRPNVRGAGVAWCAGFGRLGGVAGPLVGGLLVAAGLGLEAIFYVLTGMAAFGALLTLLVPVARRGGAARAVPVEPTAAAQPPAGR
ncbi:MFS transporter, AAHS family, benzoate transport protein [Geodermatophilus siccatus]|uniref:MFS transporter, AAHS family, benzoate transport protein n=1 Tax=Geodermatophilus siccatus TaxID=1137991 RepID=A0A1G9MPE8_9ACTN|nr:aromatic acid/H+ symport family MFS transporter [Geodermatophilus siccatus]SDL76099.1 MFS transporter, AAHS family, benzoate transport protein [Geodermatophilus siccatus]